MTEHPTRPPRRESGFAMLAVLLLALLVSSLSMGYARHAVMAADGMNAVLRSQRAQHATDTGVVWARQSLLAGTAGSTSLGLDDETRVDISIDDLGGNRRRFTVAGTSDGASQSLSGVAETYATLGGGLPTLTTAARDAIASHPSVTVVSGTRAWNATSLSGLILLQDGAAITLNNVVLNGTIVSEAAVRGSWSDSDRTSIIIGGSLLITPDAALAGCAIVAPDATVTGLSTSAVQLEGTVVCDTLQLSGWGALHAPVACAQPPSYSAAIDLVGSGREPRAWPAALDTGAQGVSRLVFPKQEPTPTEERAIEGFAFPAVPVSSDP